MVIWLEALTGKQALLMGIISEELSKLGYEILITTRRYDYTVGILKMLGYKPLVIGGYGGKTLEGKLIASAERQLKLAKQISRLKVELHVTFTSPDSSRVAFGLGVPILALSDSPHSHFVNRLSLPLADRLITPKCIPLELFSKLIESDKIIQFNGLFELAWILRKKPNREVLEELGLKEGSYVILRPEERYAAYYREPEVEKPTVADELIKVIPSDYDIIVFPRYPEQERFLKNKFGKRIIIPKKSLDTISLIKFSALVITGGSTLAQEAALMGIRAVTYFPYEVITCKEIMRLGFPLHHFKDFKELVNSLEEVFALEREVNVSELLSRLEDPIPVILKNALELIK